MTVIVSKVKGGQLVFTPPSGGGAGTGSDFSCQYTSVAITPNTDTGGAGDNEYVLCGDVVPASGGAGQVGRGDTLDITVVSDHNVADHLIAFSWKWRDKVVGFTFIPNKSPDEPGGAAQTFSGTVVMKPLTVGGEVNGDLRISASLPIASLTLPTSYGDGYDPAKDFAQPGNIYAPESTITAEDQTNADKLAGLGYVAVPSDRAWRTGEFIQIGKASDTDQYQFHWTGTAWAPGAAT